MSPRKNAAVGLAKTVYVKAYMNKIDWCKVLSRPVASFLHKYAQTKNTTIELVACMLLTNTAALLGPRTSIHISEHFKLKSNMYLFVIAKPELGKTPAWKEICDIPLKSLQISADKKFVIGDFTQAGLMRALERNDGYAYICADELCHTFLDLLQNTNANGSGFRRNLNNCFSGGGYQKEFSTQSSIAIDRTCLTIMGTTQPDKYMAVVQKFHESGDGLSHRFLGLSCPVRTPPAHFYDDYTGVFSQNWPTDLAKSIFEYHNTNGNDIKYDFTDEAKEYFSGIRAASKEVTDESYAQLEEMIAQGNSAGNSTASSSIHIPDETTKDGDQILKMAVAIHVTRTALESMLSGTLSVANTPKTVGVDTLKTAMAMVCIMRAQEQDYIDGNKMLQNTPANSNAKDVAEMFLRSTETPSLLKEIISCPGKAVSSRMLLRRKRHLKVDQIISTMDQIASDERTRSYGKYRKVGRDTHVFYKAPVENVSEAALQLTGVTRNEYKVAYETDMTVPPFSFENWTAYYGKLLDHIPDFE